MKICLDYTHPLLGAVQVRSRTGCRRVIARWKNGIATFTVPENTSTAEVKSNVESLAPRLLALKKSITYSEGQRIVCPDIEFVIGRQRLRPTAVLASPGMPVSHINVGTELDFGAAETARIISRILCRLAAHAAPTLLLPRAKEIAMRVGAVPEGWKIGRGSKVLGSCDIKGIITLSHVLVFMPLELRDYIVCHELAHLHHMNHSARFHALCNTYCGGRVAELQATLKRFRFPILR